MALRKSISVKFTDNFSANLSSIETFWAENQFPQAYDRLLDELGETVIPNLERFPEMGRMFLDHKIGSVEAASAAEKIKKRLAKLGGPSQIREYIFDDYIVIYLLQNVTVYLLSIKHHKQLSFDFARLWQDD
jgi:plasmid stabilization system protein ParE